MIWPLLRTRRWRGFTVVVVVSIAAFGLLSAWQWSRADERRLERLELQAALAADPADIATVDLRSPAAVAWNPVTVRGTYLPDAQAVVRKRPLDARNGFWVMTAMRTDDDRVVWVNRGWLPAGENALSTPPVPSPPTGTVAITGYLREGDQAAADANTGLPEGQVAAPAIALLPPIDAEPVYVQLATSTPPQEGLVPIPLPTIDEGRNVSYAVQWLLFAAVAIAGWYYFLQREAREDAERATAPAGTQDFGG